jgi:hypothetical protein
VSGRAVSSPVQWSMGADAGGMLSDDFSASFLIQPRSLPTTLRDAGIQAGIHPTFLPTLARVLDLKESPKRRPGTLSAIRVSASTSPAVKRVLVTPQEPLTILLLVLVLGAEAFPVPMVAIFIRVVFFWAEVLLLAEILPASA